MQTKIIIKIILLLCIVSQMNIKAQIGIGTSDPKAALDVTSATQGILIPRLTATQAEAISNPAIGELVYSTTNNGTVIKSQGFWYYDGAMWKPFGGILQSNIDLYNGDGTLTSNRIVTMNGNNLSFDSDKLTVLATDQKVGIGTNTPQRILDVNGNVRVRSLTAGNVMATSNGTLITGSKVSNGTLKESLRSTDHNGWYKLDGRAISTLPAVAQTNDATLGMSGNLFNAQNRMIKQGSTLALGGSGVLARNNLPNYSVSGPSSIDPGHTHTFTATGANFIPDTNGNAFVLRAGRGPVDGTASVTWSEPNHSHVSFNNIAHSGGSGVPLNLVPESITYTYFIYLGQ